MVSHLVQTSLILWLLLNFVFFTHLGEHPSLTPGGVLNWHMQPSTPQDVVVAIFKQCNWSLKQMHT